ncbi:MAG: Ribonuclease BN [Candidatus Ozemobacter sibiricus]|jgi:membrane protein|uniref:Ribonuclease BN n=1 Tax=Candidatus Ozemobacter sibiricus TaxID=2268124 RepID=A0A367ZRJ0_9BACT|nr:MAG: Ribonuclease BN [Candidatus Ozemobacter sibiricus]
MTPDWKQRFFRIPDWIYRAYDLGEAFAARFSAAGAMDAAAAIAYYAIFSLFPLMLVLVALHGSVLQDLDVQAQILDAADHFFPGSRSLVSENLFQIVTLRGTVGLVSMLTLLWSATGVFAGISQNVNLAWPSAPSRHFLMDRLLALIMIGALVLFMVLSVVISAGLRILKVFFPPPGTPLDGPSRFAHEILLRGASVFLLFLAFLFLYKFIPNTKVRWGEAAFGAIFATTAWEASKAAFIWYLGSGWSSYQVVYGSLAAVVAFLLWVYLSTLIILAGAHLSALYAHRHEQPILEDPHDLLPGA